MGQPEPQEDVSTTFLSAIAFGVIFVVCWFSLWFILKG